MHNAILRILRYPLTSEPLHLEQEERRDASIYSGWLVSEQSRNRYPVRNFIPRFVPESNYADNFGLQWNKFRQTQLDSFTGLPISADRFWKATGWDASQIRGKWVLDAGCGAGRFAQVALEAGANVVALDYSSAVDACYANLKHHQKLHVVQGDLYSLPFIPQSFDFVYSLGVLQHTPDVAGAFDGLPRMVKSGGHLCVDFYEKSWKSALLPKYWLRPITKRLPKPFLFATLESAVPAGLRASRLMGRVPLLGRYLTRIVPVANYDGILPLNEKQHLEWSLLDTFDWLAPEYDYPQTAKTVRRWLESAGLREIQVLRAGHLVGRGTMIDAPRN
jgi:2-polyprenyl-3-methyl-5-hydroxy-6-metoxy-1,4-benzoquinol methylase